MKTVLLIVRDIKLRQLLKSGLETQAMQVFSTANGREGASIAHRESVDVVVVNILGLEEEIDTLFSTIRAEVRAPILLLTTSNDESGEVAGVSLSADDYVIMPVGIRELTARINTVHRRAINFPHSTEVLRAGNILLEPSRYAVYVNDFPVQLTPIEFHLLKTLILAAGKAISRPDLLAEIQPISPKISPRSIDVHIRNLRAKLGKLTNHYYIETVYGVGYRLSIPK